AAGWLGGGLRFGQCAVEGSFVALAGGGLAQFTGPPILEQGGQAAGSVLRRQADAGQQLASRLRRCLGGWADGNGGTGLAGGCLQQLAQQSFQRLARPREVLQRWPRL